MLHLLNLNPQDNMTRRLLIFPTHCNHHGHLIFGGKFLEELDLAAADEVRTFLKKSKSSNDAVTHKCNVTFCRPSYVGDTLVIESFVKSAGRKSIVVELTATLDSPDEKRNGKVAATAEFVFIAISPASLHPMYTPEFLNYVEHGLKVENE